MSHSFIFVTVTLKKSYEEIVKIEIPVILKTKGHESSARLVWRHTLDWLCLVAALLVTKVGRILDWEDHSVNSNGFLEDHDPESENSSDEDLSSNEEAEVVWGPNRTDSSCLHQHHGTRANMVVETTMVCTMTTTIQQTLLVWIIPTGRLCCVIRPSSF